MDNLNNRVSSLLHNLRVSKGLTKTELAHKVGLDHTMIGRYERVDRGMTLTRLEEIGKALGYNVKVVFEEIPKIPKLARVEV